MTAVWLIVAMGAGVYALRLGGLLLPAVTLPARWEAALRFVPIALLSALVAASLAAPAPGAGRRLAAAVVGALVARGTGQMWACILGGMVAYWLLGLT